MGTCQYNNCKSYLEVSNFNTNTTANIIEQISNDFIVVQEDFQHSLYGPIDILEFREPRQFDFKLAHKLLHFADKEEFQQALQYYEAKFYGFNHPNLLIIHAMQYKKIDQFFDTSYKISLFLDYYETNLAQELIYRKKIYFEETEILFFLDSLIGSQAFLQSKGLAVQNFKFENIYLTNLLNGAIGLKIQSPLIQNQEDSSFNQLYQMAINGEIVELSNFPFISPEQWQIINNKKMEPYNQFKSNVFILGLMTLELCSVKQSLSLYQDFMIDEKLLQEQINRVNDRYGEALPLILQAMLNYDPKIRCDFLELDELLNSSQLRGKRLAQIWTSEDYQYSLNDRKVVTNKNQVNFSTKQHSLVHPEINSQLSNQSLLQKGSHMSIRQVLSKNSKESRASSSFIQRKESYSPQVQKKNLFKKFETEQASKGGSKKLITQDGYGVESTPDGLMYEGNFQGGKKNGQGKLFNDDNEVIYEGYFHDNQFHRTGILKNRNPKILMEAFDYKDFDKLQNYWARYDGDFECGKMHGYGQLVLTNAERFTGLFANDKINGTGVFLTLDGKQIRGTWNNNKLQDQ